MSILQELHQQKNFSATDIAISNFIINHLEEFIASNVKELAKLTYTSPASIVRFCQRFEVAGFSEFKNKLLQELLHQQDGNDPVNVNLPFINKKSFQDIGKDLYLLMSKSLEQAFFALDFSQVEQVVQLIQDHPNLHLFGISLNNILIQDFQYKMLRLGKSVFQCPIPGDERLYAANIPKDDLVILVSYSGETSLILSICKILKLRGIKTIAITRKKKNSLAELADIQLVIRNDETSIFNVSNYSTEISLMYLFDVIYSCLFSLNFERNYLHKITNEQFIRSKEIQVFPVEDPND